MESLFLLIRLILAAVLATAGIAKLADLEGSRQAMRDFGLSAKYADWFGLLLPVAEVAIALTLLPATTAWVSALAAFALFLLFIVAIGVNLARGRTPNCHCFGQLHSRPIGRATLIRNVILVWLAGVIVAQGPYGVGPGLAGWVAGLSPSAFWLLVGLLLVAALVSAQGWVVLNLLRQNGRLLLRLEAIEKQLGLPDSTATPAQSESAAPKGLPVGSVAPDFDLPALDGSRHSLTSLLAEGKPLLLFFSSDTCGPCIELMGEVAQWQDRNAKQLTIVLINRGKAETVSVKAGAINKATILLQKDAEVAAGYLVTATPSALLIGTDGKIRSAIAGGATAVRELVHNANQPLAIAAQRLMRQAPIQLQAAQSAPRPRPLAPALGTDAPNFHLPDLKGQMVELTHFSGRPTLLLFWNPNCGFCRRMLSDLQRWEANPNANSPHLVLVSAGTAEMNQAQGLSASILLDEGFAVGQAYGVKGTPSALLVDAQGKVASSLVVGASSIMPLLADSTASATPVVAQPLAA